MNALEHLVKEYRCDLNRSNERCYGKKCASCKLYIDTSNETELERQARMFEVITWVENMPDMSAVETLLRIAAMALKHDGEMPRVVAEASIERCLKALERSKYDNN